jgi:hypothetical protein
MNSLSNQNQKTTRCILAYERCKGQNDRQMNLYADIHSPAGPVHKKSPTEISRGPSLI